MPEPVDKIPRALDFRLAVATFAGGMETVVAAAGAHAPPADTTTLLLIDASALAGVDEYAVLLPSPGIPRLLAIVVSALGAGSSKILLAPDAGLIQGAASEDFDATVKAGLLLACDGTNWHYVATYGVA